MHLMRIATRSVLLAIAAFTAATGCGGKSLDIGNGSAASAGSTGDPGSTAAGAATSAGTGMEGGPDPASTTTAIVQSQQSAHMLAIDATRLYWLTIESENDPTSTTHVNRCDKADCANTIVQLMQLPRGDSNPATVAGWRIHDSTMGFAIYNQRIVSCPIDGCDQPTVVAKAYPSGPLALDDTNVFWMDQMQSAIFSCPVTGCDQPTHVIAVGMGSGGLIADSTELYWINQGTFDAAATIMAAPKDGSAAPRVIAGQQNMVMTLASNDGYVYWVTSFAVGKLLRCPVSGCGPSGPEILLDHRYFPNQLWVDENGAVWAEDNPACAAGCDSSDSKSARIFACALQDCQGTLRQVTDAAVNSENITRLNSEKEGLVVADSSYVYWIASDGTDDSMGLGTMVRSIRRAAR